MGLEDKQLAPVGTLEEFENFHLDEQATLPDSTKVEFLEVLHQQPKPGALDTFASLPEAIDNPGELVFAAIKPAAELVVSELEGFIRDIVSEVDFEAAAAKSYMGVPCRILWQLTQGLNGAVGARITDGLNAIAEDYCERKPEADGCGQFQEQRPPARSIGPVDTEKSS